jgi:hypothetical protein
MVEVDQSLVTLLSNQGLAVGVSIFLIYWVTNQVSTVLERVATVLTDHDRKSDQSCAKMAEMCQKVDEIHRAVVK